MDDRFYRTKKKLVKSGSLLEVYNFGNDILLGPRYKKSKSEIEEELDSKYPKPKASSEELLNKSARRAKRTIRRLIKANSFYWYKPNGMSYLPITITLTFKENIQDIKQANYEFTKFIRRLNYEANKIIIKNLKESNLKYIAVFEKQKRGAIHYHCIFFNLPYIENIYDKMRDIWGQGMINVGGTKKGLNKIKDQDKLNKIIDYFIKYIQKSFFDNNYKSKKKYQTSKGLIKPKTTNTEELVNLIMNKVDEKYLKYKKDGEQEYYDQDIFETIGKPKNYLRWVNYFQYDLSSNSSLNDEIDEILEQYS